MAYTITMEEDTEGIAAGLAPGSLLVNIQTGYGTARVLLGALRQMLNAHMEMNRLNWGQVRALEEALTEAGVIPM